MAKMNSQHMSLENYIAFLRNGEADYFWYEDIDELIEHLQKQSLPPNFEYKKMLSTIYESARKMTLDNLRQDESLSAKMPLSSCDTNLGRKEVEALSRFLSGNGTFADLDKIKKLIEKKTIDINEDIAEGRTLLHASVISEQKSLACCVVQTTLVLLSMGANPNYVDNYGRTPLHYAAIDGNMPAAMILLRMGANPFIQDQDALTSFDYALRVFNPEMTRIIYETSASADIEVQTPSIKDIGEYLVSSKKFNPDDRKNSQEQTILHKAVLNGNKEDIEYALSIKTNPEIIDKFGKTALDYAVASINYAAFNLIKNQQDGTSEVTYGIADIIRYARDHAMDVQNIKDLGNNNLLHHAVMFMNGAIIRLDLISFLLNSGVSLTEANKNGQKPLDCLAVNLVLKSFLLEHCKARYSSEDQYLTKSDPEDGAQLLGDQDYVWVPEDL